MKTEHDDGNWNCDDCQFQSNKIEYLRQNLKNKGHQPSESARRQSSEVKECYTCRKEFEGFTALMDHRAKQHPSNKLCKKIPDCKGYVNGKKMLVCSPCCKRH